MLTVVEPGNAALELTTTTVYGEFGQVESVTTTTAGGDSRAETFEYGNTDKLHPTATVNALTVSLDADRGRRPTLAAVEREMNAWLARSGQAVEGPVTKIVARF